MVCCERLGVGTRRAAFLAAVLLSAAAGFAAPWAKETSEKQAPLVRLTADSGSLEQDWQVVGKAEPTDDEILGQKVFQVALSQGFYLRSKKSFSAPYEVEVLVRFSDKARASGYSNLYCGVRDKDGQIARGFYVSVSRYLYAQQGWALSAHLGEGTLWTQPLRPPDGRRTAWGVGLIATEKFAADKISPVWDEEFRIGVENDMAKLPHASELWHRLLVHVRPGRMRILHNSLLALDEETSVQADGGVKFDTVGEARIASLEVRPLAPESNPDFVPAPLDGVVNARGPVQDASLPSAEREVMVQGIPFVFPARDAKADHVDVGQSLFRYRQGYGYGDADPLNTFSPPTVLDPSRIVLRVPADTYQRVWVVAASDGEPNSTPVLNVRFFKPYKGWPLDSAVRVPEFTAKSAPPNRPPALRLHDPFAVGYARSKPLETQRLKVKMADGSPGALWLVPIEIDAAVLASDYREEDVLHLELTRVIKEFRAFPDPMFYASYPGGLPSAVRVYAVTLEKAPLSVISSGTRTGKVYPYPEQPVWAVDLKSQIRAKCEARIQVEITSPKGEKERFEEAAVVAPGAQRRLEFRPALRVYGLHRVHTTVTYGEDGQARDGAFLTLPPDARVTDEHTSRWGVWCWGGGHETNPNPEENLQLLRALGSRIGGHFELEKRKKWGIGPTAQLSTILYFGVPDWAKKEPYDPAEYDKFVEEFAKEVSDRVTKDPGLEYISVFAEHMISLPITHGNPPEAFGLPWHTYNEAEKESIRAHFVSAKAAFEATRKVAPKLKFLFGHCGPLFSLPFMRDNYPKELFDGYGLDTPQFERMPERPPRAVEPNHLYFLKKDMKRLGYEKKELVHVESYYPSSHPLALGHRLAADSMVRTSALSLALGSNRFFACWTLHDCEGYWGSQHYGCLGLISRRPEYNPKPAAAAFATMTQVLDTAQYDGFLTTGSRSAYCVRFKEPNKPNTWVYCLWTIRGTRPLTLTAPANARLVVVDENGNRTDLPLANGTAMVTLSPTAFWILATVAAIEKAEAGTPAYTESPGPFTIPLDNFETADWSYSPDDCPVYSKNNWDVMRAPGKMKMERVPAVERGSKVLQVALTERPEGKPFVSWFGVFSPPRPILIPGKARGLGVWGHGHSGWQRLVYEVVDAKGEVFQSVGTKDDWNCDDVHSWSYFNFDGWRFMEFPLPANSPGDDYREKDSVWWNHSAEGIADLPLSLSKVIVEMQTHQIYVDEAFPVENLTVGLDDLVAAYDDAESMTERPIQVQRAAAGICKPKASGVALPNPILAADANGVGAPTEILKLYAPQKDYDGTRVHVSIKPVEGAQEYQVWVSAYPGGRGAAALLKTKETEPLVTGLKPSFPLHFFVTYTDAAGKASKPSKSRTTVLKDEFPMK